MPELFYAEVSGLPKDMDTRGLSAYRREKLGQIKAEAEYRRSLGAELLLSRAMEHLLPDVERPLYLVVGEYGKPVLRGGQVQFSLSHSGEFVICALSSLNVGADVQRPTECNEALAKRFFTADECAALQASEDRDRAFTRLWCVKESYLKWLGTGLYRPLSSFTVALHGDRAVIPEDERCLFWQGELQGYQYAVCACGEDSKLQITKIELP